MATVKQIVAYRENYASYGGTVLPTAGSVNDPDGEAALVIVGKTVWTGLKWFFVIWGLSN